MLNIKTFQDRINALEQNRSIVISKNSPSEADTKRILIDPLLHGLGWDIYNRDIVVQEYKQSPSDAPVDYALFKNGVPVLFIEAKALNKAFARMDEIQIVNYANVCGVEWCLLTDGDQWNLYETHAKGNISNKLRGSWSIIVRDGGTTSDINTLLTNLTFATFDPLKLCTPDTAVVNLKAPKRGKLKPEREKITESDLELLAPLFPKILNIGKTTYISGSTPLVIRVSKYYPIKNYWWFRFQEEDRQYFEEADGYLILFCRTFGWCKLDSTRLLEVLPKLTQTLPPATKHPYWHIYVIAKVGKLYLKIGGDPQLLLDTFPGPKS